VAQRQYHVEQCVLSPKLDAAGDGSKYTVCSLIFLCVAFIV
jgi:hypothetical protein